MSESDRDLVLQKSGARSGSSANDSSIATVIDDAAVGKRPQDKLVLAINKKGRNGVIGVERSLTGKKGHANAKEDDIASGEVKNKADGYSITGEYRDEGEIHAASPHAYVAVQGTNIKVEVHDDADPPPPPPPPPPPKPTGWWCSLM